MPIDRPHLIERIKSIEGLTPEERSQLLEMLRTTPKYGLVWEDKPEEAERLLEDNLPVLTEVKERYIAGSSPDSPNHILIEGDNLHALTALTYTHESKIDVIYIDPPYNTGNKDFCYNDQYVDREDGYRHSKWLSFMSKRLRLAKRLLSDRGVIFISIDDNEQAQLKMLCDEIFGEEFLRGQFIWRKKSGGGQTDAYFVTEHEYVAVYSNSNFIWLDPSESKSEEDFKFEDERGKYNLTKLEKWGSSAHKEDRPSMAFPIKDPFGKDYFPIAPDKKPGRWRVGEKRMDEIFKNHLIEWRRGIPYEKTYYNPESQKEKIIKSRSILYSVAETGDGSNELLNLFGEKDTFSNPKPSELIKYLISHAVTSTILDFFAGSGTTLHATMQLNAEDGGKRQCILVTNNENGICENVTYERNKRVINGYTTPKGVAVNGLHNNSLRYYRTDFVPRKKTMANMRRLVNLATDLLCIKHGLYQEARFFGKKLNAEVARFFCNGKKQMLILYDERAVDPVAEILEHQAVDSPIIVYVFSPDNYAYDEEFAAVADKVNLCALPAAIYAAYRHVLPKKKLYPKEPSQKPTATPSPCPQGIEQLLFDPNEEEEPDGSA